MAFAGSLSFMRVSVRIRIQKNGRSCERLLGQKSEILRSATENL